MTTKKYANYIEKQTKNVINIMLELIFSDYIVYKNGKRIGFLFDNQLYLISTNNLKKLLPSAAEQQLFGFEKLILIENTEDIELLEKLISTTYNDLYLLTEYVLNVSLLMESYSDYPDMISNLYDSHITFLKFCYDKELLKLSPLDSSDRIIKMSFTNNDITETGIKTIDFLYRKWLIYTDKNDEKTAERNNNIKILEKYYATILKEVAATV